MCSDSSRAAPVPISTHLTFIDLKQQPVCQGGKKKKEILLNLEPRMERGNPDRFPPPRIWCPEREGRGCLEGGHRLRQNTSNTFLFLAVPFPLVELDANLHVLSPLLGKFFFFSGVHPRTSSRVPRHPHFPEQHHPEINNDQPVYSSRAWKGRGEEGARREAWGSPVRDLSQTFFL